MTKKTIKLINFSKYAEKYGIARSTVHRMIREGRLVVYKVGGKKRLNPRQKPPLFRKHITK